MAAGEALPDDFDYEDFVDDDEDAYEDDEEQDANYVSPLDDMDPFTIFKATVQGEPSPVALVLPTLSVWS